MIKKRKGKKIADTSPLNWLILIFDEYYLFFKVQWIIKNVINFLKMNLIQKFRKII